MKGVAKLIIIDNANSYLLLKRSDHPTFPNDSDLPGGTIEPFEKPEEALVREVREEIGVSINSEAIKKLYEGDEFSRHKTVYHLYVTELANRPEVTISWEHSSYEWVGSVDFLRSARTSTDTYMHMVYKVLSEYIKHE